MTNTFAPPTMPTAPAKLKRFRKTKVALAVAAGLFVVGAVANAGHDAPSTSTVDASTSTEAETQILAMDVIFDSSDICSSLNELVANGMSREASISFGVSTFEESFEEDGTILTTEAREHFRTLMHTC